jgi:hypothetical protein
VIVQQLATLLGTGAEPYGRAAAGAPNRRADSRLMSWSTFGLPEIQDEDQVLLGWCPIAKTLMEYAWLAHPTSQLISMAPQRKVVFHHIGFVHNLQNRGFVALFQCACAELH